MNKQPQITDETRQNIITAFCSIYQDKSIEKITISELMQKAGYHRGTFYRYFSDIYQLLDYIEQNFFLELQQQVLVLEDALTFDIFLSKLFEIFAKNQMYLDVMLKSAKNKVFIQKMTPVMLPLLSQKMGFQINSITAQYAINFYLSGAISCMSSYGQNKDIPLAELAKLLKGIVNDGILAQLKSDNNPTI